MTDLHLSDFEQFVQFTGGEEADGERFEGCGRSVGVERLLPLVEVGSRCGRAVG